MLDREAILTRLDRLAQYGRILRRLRQVPYDEFLSQVEHYGLAERYLHLSAECVFDVGQMVISGMGFRRPGEYRDIIRILVEEKVYQHLQEGLSNFDAYAQEVVVFLKANSPTE